MPKVKLKNYSPTNMTLPEPFNLTIGHGKETTVALSEEQKTLAKTSRLIAKHRAAGLHIHFEGEDPEPSLVPEGGVGGGTVTPVTAAAGPALISNVDPIPADLPEPEFQAQPGLGPDVVQPVGSPGDGLGSLVEPVPPPDLHADSAKAMESVPEGGQPPVPVVQTPDDHAASSAETANARNAPPLAVETEAEVHEEEGEEDEEVVDHEAAPTDGDTPKPKKKAKKRKFVG